MRLPISRPCMSVKAATTVSIVPCPISRSSSLSVSMPCSAPGPPGRRACSPAVSCVPIRSYIPLPVGARTAIASVSMITVLEPATEARLAELEAAAEAQVDAAVARAQASFPAWRELAPSVRARALSDLAAALERHLEELAQLEARNVGKPIADARGEMQMVTDTFRYYAGAPERPVGETIPVAGGQAFPVREPLGVVGL